MNDIVERLRDLHKQATVERSHYYVGNCALDAADRIEALEEALRIIAADYPYIKIVLPARAALAPEQKK